MPVNHSVIEGECISSIARNASFRDYKLIYDHGDNAQLKTDRPNPNVLAIGDVVKIPDLERGKEVDGATSQRHRFRITGKKLETLLRVVVQDHEGTALSGKRYSLVIDGGEPLEGSTGGDGKIEHDIEADASRGELTLWLQEAEGIDGYLFPIVLGALHHESNDAAAKTRLINLGYDCGGDSATIDEATHTAVRGFQKDKTLTVNGNLDDATKTRLRELHEGA